MELTDDEINELMQRIKACANGVTMSIVNIHKFDENRQMEKINDCLTFCEMIKEVVITIEEKYRSGIK